MMVLYRRYVNLLYDVSGECKGIFEIIYYRRTNGFIKYSERDTYKYPVTFVKNILFKQKILFTARYGGEWS